MPRSSASLRTSSRSRTPSECSDGLVDPLTFGPQCFKNLFCVQQCLLTPDSGNPIVPIKLKTFMPQKSQAICYSEIIVLELSGEFPNEFTGEFETLRADSPKVTNFLVAEWEYPVTLRRYESYTKLLS